MLRLLAIGIISGLFLTDAASQVPIGFWRDHLSYRRGTHIAVGDNTVYCSAGSGLIAFRKKDNSIEKLSKARGLSDVGISSIRWDDQYQLLIVGYENGNLDIIRQNRVTNIPYILRSSLQGSKTINNILFIGSHAYLACDFGVVVLDLERNEIKETWFPGGAATLAVYDLSYDGTFIYAATSSGIYKADINSHNLLDFSNWRVMDFLPEYLSLITSLAWFDSQLFAVQMTGSGNYAVLQISDNSWTYFAQPAPGPVRVSVSGNQLALIRESETLLYAKGLSLKEKIEGYGLWGVAMRDLQIDEKGDVWIADRLHGMVRRTVGRFDVLTPSGPNSNRVFSISTYPGRTYFTAGGFTGAFNNLWQNGEFSILSGNSWTNRLNYDVRDIIYVLEHPNDPDINLVSTWGYGIIEYHGGRPVNHFTENNSTLRSIIPGDNYVRIGGMSYDHRGNLWITNSGVPEPVSIMNTKGEWRSFNIGGAINHDHVGRIIINNLDQKWVLLPRGGGLFIFDTDESNNIRNSRKLSIINEDNVLISNEVYSIAEDQNGIIWVGLNNGIAVYHNSSNAFAHENFHARQIVVSGSRDQEHGYLLNNETVTAIAVDGANRKWLGTERSGAFLVSSDGRDQIHHFNRHNSPLLSNTITDIAVDPLTGEVYFGTTAGVVSFRGDATSPHSSFKNVYVFPNPVREDYEGPITIAGLVRNSTVKITDISGNLVYETVSLGGQAAWDGKNFSGHRVQTGIYLVFISGPDGSESHVTKLMFIN